MQPTYVFITFKLYYNQGNIDINLITITTSLTAEVSDNNFRKGEVRHSEALTFYKPHPASQVNQYVVKEK